MPLLSKLHSLKDEIYRIAHRHNALQVYVFGSCARGEEDAQSDVDLLVDFLPHATLFDQVHLQNEISSLLDCKVDVVSKRGLHPYIRKNVLAEAVIL
ncbi:MAG: nucleotidyltransferase family protein [Lentisphaeria bacterium]|jgi:predicted nucleotidyltransferase|nr:nucleotidyltransferase family protein [Lentisphaeria bacterium]MDY0176166.1 nucleotidyltransferase family protein [Lentisphaeria bacterium]NLZ59352.1 nucleotidyltransferase family protein [Lentisphaerota bacterium]